MAKLLRITTVHESLRTLLPGQLAFMQAQGFSVWAASGPDPDTISPTEIDGCPYVLLPLNRRISLWNLPNDVWAFWKTYQLIGRLRPDIVHTHTPKAGFIGMLAAWLARVPVRLHTVAGLPLMERRGLKRWMLVQLERLTYRCATEVWPNSFGLEAYIRTQLYNAPKLRVIGQGSSNGIDTNRFRLTPELRQQARLLRLELSIPETAFVWIFVGRLVRDKGINELVKSFEKIDQVVPNTYLLLVGREEALDPIGHETKTVFQTHPNIRAVGYQPDVRPYLALVNALVLPSYREGLPNVLLQAACFDKPVITTDIVGCREVVAPGETGLLVTPKDINALRETMLQLMADPARAHQMGQMARERIVSRFDQKNLWMALLEAYKQALTEQPRP